MRWNLSQILPLVTTSFTALASVAHADDAQTRNLENRVTALEQRKGASGMINPQGRPQIKDGADLFLFGDLLYWNAHENGLNYAVEKEGDLNNLDDAEVKNIHGKWNFGFRAGIGYNTPHDGWDLRLTWLRFMDNGGRKAKNKDGLYPIMASASDTFLSDATAAKARSRWNVNLNQIDLDLGREFFVSKWLTMRPHVGVRTDWIHQKWTGKYSHFISSLASGSAMDVKFKDHWYGIGLEGGLDTQWGLGNGWSIFGNLTTAILYGFHDLKLDEETKNRGVETDFADLEQTYRVSHPILDLQMGLRWDNMFDGDRYHLGVQIGWEHHIYFSQNQFQKFYDNLRAGSFVSNQGDLTFQGWTFSARFDF